MSGIQRVGFRLNCECHICGGARQRVVFEPEKKSMFNILLASRRELMSEIQRVGFGAEILASLGRSEPDARHFEPEKNPVFNFACVAGGTEASQR